MNDLAILPSYNKCIIGFLQPMLHFLQYITHYYTTNSTWR